MSTEYQGSVITHKLGFCTKVYDIKANTGKVTFHHPEDYEHKIEDYDWYIDAAISKANLVKNDRHLLTKKLLMEYRWAIREGYNHGLDPALKNRYDRPRNRNTVEGIQSYIERIKKASDKEMKGWEEQ